MAEGKSYNPVQYSFFIGKDQVVLRAENSKELAALFEGFVSEVDGGESDISRILNAINTIKGAGLLIVNPSLDVTPAQNNRQPARDVGPAERTANGKSCKECGGPMTYKSGTNAAGKAWSGWFCSVKNHPPIWG